MAYARITVEFVDGGKTIAEVGAVGAHPDLLDELVARCKSLYRETVETDGSEA